jgi:hypothetical protein
MENITTTKEQKKCFRNKSRWEFEKKGRAFAQWEI